MTDIRDLGFDFYHTPIEDMKSPKFDQMDAFIKYVDELGRVVLVHCYGGIGRTGCMVLAYLAVKNGWSGDEGLVRLREIWQPYIQTYEQEDHVVRYINSRVGRVGRRTLTGEQVF